MQARGGGTPRAAQRVGRPDGSSGLRRDSSRWLLWAPTQGEHKLSSSLKRDRVSDLVGKSLLTPGLNGQFAGECRQLTGPRALDGMARLWYYPCARAARPAAVFGHRQIHR
jgi:hypothetical protein